MELTNCPSCNNSVPPGAVFCDNCGYDLRTLAASAQQPQSPSYQAPQPEGDLICPGCGYANVAGSAFCENCGSRLNQQHQPVFEPPPAAPPPRQDMPVTPPQPAQPKIEPGPQRAQPGAAVPKEIPGYFLIEAENVRLTIPVGKESVIIGREDPVSGIFPEIDLDQFGGQDAGVGRNHAKMFLQEGNLFIEDLDSVNGTVVNRQKIASRKPHPIADGDEIRLGKMILTYHAS